MRLLKKLPNLLSPFTRLNRNFWAYIGRKINSAENKLIQERDRQITRLRADLLELSHKEKALLETKKQLMLEIEILLMNKEVR